MADDQESKEDKFDFSSEGEVLGYISLEQARLLAMQTARDTPGDYGRRFRGVRMVFQPVEEEDGEDYYVVTLSFRPEGDFAGTPGQEQFFIEKEGRVAHRQVLSHPRAEGGRHIPVIPIGIGLVIVVIVAVVGVLLVGGGGSDDEGTAAAAASQSEPVATATPVKPTPQPAESTIPTPTAEIGPSETPRAFTTPGPTPRPTPTPTPRPTATPLILTVQPDATSAPSASAILDSAPLRVLLVAAVGNSQQLALLSRARTATRVEVPVIYGLPETEYSQLRPRLWTESSLIFSGDVFSGSWSGQPRSKLVLQLEGVEDANYAYCISLRKNLNEFASSCGSRLSGYEFTDVGLTTIVRLSAPTRINEGDVFELAIVFGTSASPGGKSVPSLVYGGRTVLTSSYLEITPDTTIAGKGTCPSTPAASLSGGGSRGSFRLYMVPTQGNTQALAPANTGTGEGLTLAFPVASTLNNGGVLADLRVELWTPLALNFCGRGFSGTIPGSSRVQLQLQLGGIQSRSIPYCVGVRRNAVMFANSCSTGMSALSSGGETFRTGIVNLEGPSSSTQITREDVIEVSIDFSTGTNSRTPILHYGGAIDQTTSLIEITSNDS